MQPRAKSVSSIVYRKKSDGADFMQLAVLHRVHLDIVTGMRNFDRAMWKFFWSSLAPIIQVSEVSYNNLVPLNPPTRKSW